PPAPGGQAPPRRAQGAPPPPGDRGLAMAGPERAVEDPIMRQRYRFERQGDVLRLSLWAEPGARVPKHFHPPLEERFEVREGEFTFTVGRRKQRAGPGDRLVVPPGVPHAFANTGPGVAHFVAEIEPALQ